MKQKIITKKEDIFYKTKSVKINNKLNRNPLNKILKDRLKSQNKIA